MYIFAAVLVVAIVSQNVAHGKEEKGKGKLKITLGAWGLHDHLHYLENYECFAVTTDEKKSCTIRFQLCATACSRSYSRSCFYNIDKSKYCINTTKTYDKNDIQHLFPQLYWRHQLRSNISIFKDEEIPGQLDLNLHNEDNEGQNYIAIQLTMEMAKTNSDSKKNYTFFKWFYQHKAGIPYTRSSSFFEWHGMAKFQTMLQYEIDCLENYFGCRCTKYCISSKSKGVKNCDKNGFKICEPDYYPNETMVHYCKANGPCSLNCPDLKKNYPNIRNCVPPCGQPVDCNSGYHGGRCEFKKNCAFVRLWSSDDYVCNDRGTCIDTPTYNNVTRGFWKCKCNKNVTGTYCDQSDQTTTIATTTTSTTEPDQKTTTPKSSTPTTTTPKLPVQPKSTTKFRKPRPTDVPPFQKSKTKKGGLSAGAIVGIVMVVLIALAVAGFIGFRVYRAKQYGGNGGAASLSSDDRTTRISFKNQDSTDDVTFDNPNF